MPVVVATCQLSCAGLQRQNVIQLLKARGLIQETTSPDLEALVNEVWSHPEVSFRNGAGTHRCAQHQLQKRKAPIGHVYHGLHPTAVSFTLTDTSLQFKQGQSMVKVYQCAASPC